MLAVVFPGQGSQQVGMAMGFVRSFPESRRVIEEAEASLGLPLARWMAEGPEEVLRRTEITQPALLTASIAIYRVVESRLPAEVTYLAGHSLGEYSALVAAGGLALGDAVQLVRRRGALMQEAAAAQPGEMMAVLGLAGDDVDRICAEIGGQVWPANYNAPQQTVVAGGPEALQQAATAFRAAGAKKLVSLPVSAAFHCPLMTPAMEQLSAALAETPFRGTRVPVISNVTAEPYSDAAQARSLLRQQVCAPVRWLDCVRTLFRGGVRAQLEVGPGRVLTSLTVRIERGLRSAGIAEPDDLAPALERVTEALA